MVKQYVMGCGVGWPQEWGKAFNLPADGVAWSIMTKDTNELVCICPTHKIQRKIFDSLSEVKYGYDHDALMKALSASKGDCDGT